MNLGARNISTLVMNKCAQVTHVDRHFAGFSMEIPTLARTGQYLVKIQFGTVYCVSIRSKSIEII